MTLSLVTRIVPCCNLSETKPESRGKGALVGIAILIVIVILSLGFVAYASLNPHIATVTQQQFLTNTQNQYVTQTVTWVSTVTTVGTVTTSVSNTYGVTLNAGAGYVGSGSGSSYNCGIYGCSPPSLGAYGTPCQSTNQSNTVRCSGYLSEPGDGCTVLAIPYWNPDLLESTAYQYYTLRNVTSSLPSPGSWITVIGQVGVGYTPGSNGASCPGNYVNVNSVTP